MREQAWGMRAVAKRSRRSGCAAPRLRFCARNSLANRRLWKLRPRRRGARGRAASAAQGLRGDRAALPARARAARRLKKAISALRFKTLVARPRELRSCRARGYRKLLYHAWRVRTLYVRGRRAAQLRRCKFELLV